MTKDNHRIRHRAGGKNIVKNPAQKDAPDAAGNYAERFLGSEMQSALSMKGCYPGKDFTFLKVGDLISELQTLTSDVNRNDLSGLERMLAAQIYTLDQIFHLLLRKAVSEQASPECFKTYMNCALRAQSQTRASIEAVAEIKNPKPFMQQQNIAYNQQVNNASRTIENAPSAKPPRARERILNSTNKLLSHEEKTPYAPLDTRGAGTPVPAYSEMETMGKIYRPQNH